MGEHQEVSRHKPPRQDCMDAGYDYPHEGWGLVILAGEWHCPACTPRAWQKWDRGLEIEKIVEQKRFNDQKEIEILRRQQGEWEDDNPKPRTMTKIVLPEPPKQPSTRGGIKVDPRKKPI